MRGPLPELTNPHPLAAGLPAAFHDSDFTVRFVSSFDGVVAPAIAALDSFDAYLDPGLCPPDFLPFLAAWVGLELDGNWSLEQQRRLVATAVALARWHGTLRGVAELVCRYAGLTPEAVEVTDSGGVGWSTTPGGNAPGQDQPHVTVRVLVSDEDAIDVARLRRLVASSTPAHVPCTVAVAPSE